MKICRLCGIAKPLNQFYKASWNPKHTDGRRNACIPCMNRATKQRYREDREHVLERTRAYAKAHADRLEQAKKAWQANHREQVREYSREWRRRHPERANAWYRKNKARHRALVRAWTLRNIERAQAQHREAERRRRAKLAAQHPEKIRRPHIHDVHAPRSCCRCRQEKPASAFPKRRHTCKACRAARERQRQQSDPVAYREAKRRRYRLNPRVRQTACNAALRRRARLKGNGIEPVDLDRVMARDGMLCHICRREVSLRDLTFDHLIPVAQGGPHAEWNLAVAHRRCNSRRGNGRLPAQLKLRL